MAGKIYQSTASFKPPANKLPTATKVSYSVSVDNTNNQGITKVFRNNEDGTNVLIGTYPKRDAQQTSNSAGNFQKTNDASADEFNYFFANGNSVVATYAAPLITNQGDNPNDVLGTNFATAPTASLSTNPAAAGTPQAPKPGDTKDVTDLKIDSSAGEGTVRAKLAAIEARYPENIDSSKQDIIMFRLKEIIGRKFGTAEEKDAGKSKFSFGQKSLSETFGSVVLPIQPSITDSNGVEWGGSNLDPLSAYAGRAALSIISGDDIGTQTLAALKDAGSEFKQNFSTYSKFINLYFAQEAIGATGLLSRATGAVLNPNLELLFNGPTLRSFNFTFKLSPRSESEATIVKKIIYFFKAGMAVRQANTGVFLKSPYVFNIKYIAAGTDKEHKSLNRMKDCALLGCDVDYTPDGSYMTFNDREKTITSYQITLRFSELDPLYNEDYVEPHPIGY